MSYFTPEEFLCPCGRPDCEAPKTIAPLLLEKLNTLRYRLDRPVIITSGLRCPSYNQRVGGVRTSEHLTGEGVDMACGSSADRWDVFQANWMGMDPLFTRLGMGTTFLHVGISTVLPNQMIWTYTSTGGKV